MAYAGYADRATQTDQYEVVIDGVSYPVEGPISVDPLSRFQNKSTFGDYSEDSDPLQSAVIWRSFTGGIGKEELKEGVDDETYWTGTLETRYPGQITLLPQTRVHRGPASGVAMAYPVADYPADAPSFWAAFDTTITRFDAITETFVQVGSLPAAPVNRGVEYFDLLYIPLGADGYATVERDGTITVDDTIPARDFAVWDNKLAVLTDDGYLRLRFEDTAWEAANDALKVPSGSVPRHLVIFRNSRSEPTIHIVTSNSVWSYDRDAEALYLTELQFPHHPDQGRAAINWRGESMYVSVGLGIHSYNGSIVASMGPDGRYGLPAELRGLITGMEAEYNGILALIKGYAEAPEDLEPTYKVGETSYLDEFRPWVEMQAKSSLLRFSGYGWHPVWESPDVGGDPTWPMVSVADNQYWLWWGWNGDLYRQKLPHTFHNPKQGLKSGVNEFAERGDLVTGWFDADMPAFRKLASHMEIVLEDALGTGRPTGTATLYYQVDEEPGWKVLGTADRVGRTVMAFGLGESEGSSVFSEGMAFTRIRFRLELKRPTSEEPDEERFLRRQSPVVRVFLLKFIKLPMSRSGRAFTFRVPLIMDRDYKGRGTHELAERLIAHTHGERFVEMLHGGESYRIRVSQVRMTDMTGYDQRAVAEVSAVEVVVPPDEWLPLPGERL